MELLHSVATLATAVLDGTAHTTEEFEQACIAFAASDTADAVIESLCEWIVSIDDSVCLRRQSTLCDTVVGTLLRVASTSARELFFTLKSKFDTNCTVISSVLCLSCCITCMKHQKSNPKPFNSAVEEDLHEAWRGVLLSFSRQLLLKQTPAKRRKLQHDVLLCVSALLALACEPSWASRDGTCDGRTWLSRTDSTAEALWALLALKASISGAQDEHNRHLMQAIHAAGHVAVYILVTRLQFDAVRAARLCSAGARGLLLEPPTAISDIIKAKGGLTHIWMGDRAAAQSSPEEQSSTSPLSATDTLYLALAHAAYPSPHNRSSSPDDADDDDDDAGSEEGDSGANVQGDTATGDASMPVLHYGCSRLRASTSQKRLAVLLCSTITNGCLLCSIMQGAGSSSDGHECMHSLLHAGQLVFGALLDCPSSPGSIHPPTTLQAPVHVHGQVSLPPLHLACTSLIQDIASRALVAPPSAMPAVLRQDYKLWLMLPQVASLVHAAEQPCMLSAEVSVTEGVNPGHMGSEDQSTEDAEPGAMQYPEIARSEAVSACTVALYALDTLRLLLCPTPGLASLSIPPVPAQVMLSHTSPQGQCHRTRMVVGGEKSSSRLSLLSSLGQQMCETRVEGTLAAGLLTLLLYAPAGVSTTASSSGMQARESTAQERGERGVYVQCLHRLLDQLESGSRLQLVAALYARFSQQDSVRALLLDRVRHDVSRALSPARAPSDASAAAAAGGAPSPYAAFVDHRLGVFILDCAEERIHCGFVCRPTLELQSGDVSKVEEPGTLAQWLGEHTRTDTALLALLRLVCLVQKQRAGATSLMLSGKQAQKLHAGYVYPLLAAITSLQAHYRQVVGRPDLHAYAGTYMPTAGQQGISVARADVPAVRGQLGSADMASSTASSTATASAAGSGTVAGSGSRSGGSPPAIAQAEQHLSTTFLYQAALEPALEALQPLLKAD